MGHIVSCVKNSLIRKYEHLSLNIVYCLGFVFDIYFGTALQKLDHLWTFDSINPLFILYSPCSFCILLIYLLSIIL